MINAEIATNALGHTPERTDFLEGSRGPTQEAQKPKMLEVQRAPDSHVPHEPPQRFCACCLVSANRIPKPQRAQTLKPRARSWSRPSSVIISMPHGGIQTQLITHRSTSPSSAV